MVINWEIRKYRMWYRNTGNQFQQNQRFHRRSQLPILPLKKSDLSWAAHGLQWVGLQNIGKATKSLNKGPLYISLLHLLLWGYHPLFLDTPSDGGFIRHIWMQSGLNMYVWSLAMLQHDKGRFKTGTMICNRAGLYTLIQSSTHILGNGHQLMLKRIYIYIYTWQYTWITMTWGGCPFLMFSLGEPWLGHWLRFSACIG